MASILITGGASGLGKSIAKQLASRENDEIIITYNTSKIEAEELANQYENISILRYDLTDFDSRKEFLSTISEQKIDILINNAYYTDLTQAYFHKTPKDKFYNEFSNNLVPFVELNQLIVSKLRKNKGGRILTILTSGLHGSKPIGWASYLSFKSATKTICETIAKENARFGVVSNMISPSLMETEMTRVFDNRILDSLRESHPLKRFLRPEEVSELVEYMIGSSLHINGVDILLDAGQSI